MILLLLALTDTTPQHKWNATDDRMAAIASALIVNDFITTVAMRESSNGNWREYNPLLGVQPSVPKLAVASAVSIAATWTLPRLIHNKVIRRGVLIGVIGIESWTVSRNVAVIIGLPVPHKGHWL